MEATEKPAKKPGTKKPGTCTVQSLDIASETLSNLSSKLDARTAYVVAAAIGKFAQLDTTEQVEMIQDVRVAHANNLNS